MKLTSSLIVIVLASLVGGCSADPQSIDADTADHDVPNVMDAVLGVDRPTPIDGEPAPVDAQDRLDVSNGLDAPNGFDVFSRDDAQDVRDIQDVRAVQDAPVAQDVQNVRDSDLTCAAQDTDCDPLRNNCCEGTACMFMKIASNRCRPVAMCSRLGEVCNPGLVYCCPFSVCGRAGAGQPWRCVAP